MAEGTTPFHEAAKIDNYRVLEYLIRVFKSRNEFIKLKIKPKGYNFSGSKTL
jgi:hypothetical protein